MLDTVGVGDQEAGAFRERGDAGPEGLQQRSHRRPQVDAAPVLDERRAAIDAAFKGDRSVGGDVRLGERALEERDQPALDGQRQLAVGAQGLDDVRQQVGEHHLVAQALFGADHQVFAGQRLARRPAWSADVEPRGLDQILGEPGFVGLPAFLDAAQRQQGGRPAKSHGRQLVRLGGVGDRQIAVGQGALDVAQVEFGVGAVVVTLAIGRFQSNHFVEEGDGPPRVAHAAHHGAQGVPQQWLVRPLLNRGPQDLDGLLVAVQIAKGAGQVVEAFQIIGADFEKVDEELGGDLRHIHAQGQSSQVAGRGGLAGQQLQRRLVAMHRVREVADLLARDGQRMPSQTQLIVVLQGFERQLLAPGEIALLHGADCAIEKFGALVVVEFASLAGQLGQGRGRGGVAGDRVPEAGLDGLDGGLLGRDHGAGRNLGRDVAGHQ